MKWLKKLCVPKDIHVCMLIHFPDSSEESQGYDIPSQLDEMLEAINMWNRTAGHFVTLSVFDHQAFIEECKRGRL